MRTGEKSNEITAVPELLDRLDVKGDTISIDAMGCQTDIAAKIREKEADYVLPVKENQPALHREIQEYFEFVEEVDLIPSGRHKDKREIQRKKRKR